MKRNAKAITTTKLAVARETIRKMYEMTGPQLGEAKGGTDATPTSGHASCSCIRW